jgi:ubiquinol-cytochrome c reductase iron-sulfur subunit
LSDATGPGSPPPHRTESVRERPAWPAGLGALATLVGGVGFAWAFAGGAGHSVMAAFLTLGAAGLAFALAWWGWALAGERPEAEPYPLPSEDQGAAAALADELESDMRAMTRRRFVAGLLGVGAGAFGLSLLFFAGGLGPLPRGRLSRTQWSRGRRLVTFDGTPITTDMLSAGGFVVAFPEGATDAAESQVVLLQFSDKTFTPLPGRETWSPQGFVAYSRVCTHAGCPVAQYEDESHVLLCPCHQSTFDVLDGARVVFGPAGRPLPQLPLMILPDGTLAAQSDFTEPVGPGFWNLPS